MSEQADIFAAPVTSRFPPAREFQERAHRELRAGFKAGHRTQLLMAPTGAGKTYCALRICDEALRRGNRVFFVCDRKTLINQTSAVADGYGMPAHGIVQAKNPRMALWRPFQIASAQTLALRGIDVSPDVVVVDEAHTLHAAVVRLVQETKAAVIGLSATPFTRGLGKIYSRVVNAATMDELVKLGVLSPLRVLTCVRPDMRGAKTTGGEWTAAAAGERGEGLIGDVVKEWLAHADGRKTIAFGPTVLHAETLVARFRAADIGARLFTGQTTEGERAELLREYRKPDSRIRVLVSVEALAKGFDVPDVGCVIDCRPLRKSLSTFVQMVGRGLRASPGKADCLLLDHSGNIQRFADDFARIYFDGLADLDSGEALDAEVRKEKPPDAARACPSCGFAPVGKRCIRCGFEAQRTSLIEHGDGEAVELDILGTGRESYARDRLELWRMLCWHAESRFRSRGYGKPEGAAWHRYRELTGQSPPRGMPYEEAIRAEVVPSRALQGKLRSLAIAYARRRGR